MRWRLSGERAVSSTLQPTFLALMALVRVKPPREVSKTRIIWSWHADMNLSPCREYVPQKT